MTVTTDLLATWHAPRVVLRRHLARDASEPFAFAFLLIFLTLAFVSQWPLAAREAYLANEASATPRILARAFAVLATIPLWYGLAALSRLVARVFGGKGSWYAARVALFWALAAVGPLMLLQGLVRGFLGAGPALAAIGVVVLIAFLLIWANTLIEAERA